MGNSVATTESFDLAVRQAKAFALSALVPDTLRGSWENCLAAIMIADEMGESRIAVMQSIYFVGGRASFLAQYMISRANRSGKFRGPLRWIVEGGGPALAVTCYADLAEVDDRVQVMVSMAMAKAEGWTRNKKYETIPELMLMYRSATWLIRLYVPEVMMGLPASEELEDNIAPMINVTPPMPKLSDFAPPAKGKTTKEQAPDQIQIDAVAAAIHDLAQADKAAQEAAADYRRRAKQQNPEDGPPAHPPAGCPQEEANASPNAASPPEGANRAPADLGA